MSDGPISDPTSLPAPSYTLITGAASGIGREFARALGPLGHRVLLIDVNAEQLEAVADELRSSGSAPADVIALPQDLSVRSGPRQIFNFCNERGIDVSMLINNAAIGTYLPFEQQPLWRIEEIVRTNVLAVASLARLFVPAMLRRGSGTIVNVTSIAAFESSPWWSVYGATKAFVQNFTDTLHDELADRGIYVAAVCPGMTKTNFFIASGTETPSDVQDPREVVAEALAGLEKRQRLIVTGRNNRIRIAAQQANLRRLASRIRFGLRKVGVLS